MFAAYPAHGSAEVTESAIGTYTAILREYPISAIIESAKAFLSGRVSGYNPAFRPSCAQWASEARKAHQEAQTRFRLASMPKKAIRPPEPYQSLEERASVMAKWELMIKELAGTSKPPIEQRPARRSITIDDLAEMEKVASEIEIKISPTLSSILKTGKPIQASGK